MKTIEIDEDYLNPAYYEALTDNTRVQIIFGGASSGKSVFLAQRVTLDTISGRNTLVLRNTAKTLRSTCWNEIAKAITSMSEITPLFTLGKSEMIITCANGRQIMFAGLDDVEKIKSITPATGVLTDIWIEEATEVEYDDYKQLVKRLRGKMPSGAKPKRITLSFNPIYKEHWIYNQFFGGWDEAKTELREKGLVIRKTTYKDNRFLEQDDIDALEDETDEYYKNVYTYGNWGILGDVIFRNWRVEDLTDMKLSADKLMFGLDFGFSSDPCGALKVFFYKPTKTIYILDELHERGLTNTMLAEILTDFCKGEYITCDSAEPKSIKELQGAGIRAVGAVKGPDSVEHGIQWLQGCTIVVDKKCQNMKNELQLYQWRKDKDGKSMRVPEDKHNHLIDALRYCMETESLARYAGTAEINGSAPESTPHWRKGAIA